MARGKKLDLNIGADFGEGWGVVDDASASAEQQILLPQKHMIVFKKEKRRGKPVTICGPFFLSKADTSALLKRLKKSLGCGGTQKEEAANTFWLEFQGDMSSTLRERLVNDEGFRLKR